MPRLDDSRHAARRATLRRIGPLVAIAGAVLVAIGMLSFFTAFGGGGRPTYFWCAFVGMPLLAIGLAITKFGYVGTITRYVANETTPVGVDVVNTMAHGTKDAVRDVATAVGEGLGAARGGERVEVVRCHKCNATNDADASFCKACGTPLVKSRPCPSCHELNDPDARFCDRCGKPIPEA